MKTAPIVFFILISSNIFAQTEKDFETLGNWMQGSYTSEEQSKNDSDYYSISLNMIRIWENRTDGYWFYVEQAASESIEKPYRQRISHLVQENGLIKNIIFSLPDERKFIGGYNNPELFNSLAPDSLEEKIGCEVIIKRQDKDTFTGSTVEDNCTNNLRGASYATSDFTITSTMLISLDRGYNDKGQQVWGAEKGGYIFKKIK
jgi:hypothetical protein